MKQCSRCREVKPVSCFTPNLPGFRDGLRSWCRDCVAEYNRNWRREKVRVSHAGDKIRCIQCWTPLSPAVGRKYRDQICRDCAPDNRWRAIVRRYGIDRHMFDAMYFEQDGKCAIESCQREAKNIDHDHTTGAVRGLLCQGCNVAIGFMEVDGWLAGALGYLAEAAVA